MQFLTLPFYPHSEGMRKMLGKSVTFEKLSLQLLQSANCAQAWYTVGAANMTLTLCKYLH